MGEWVHGDLNAVRRRPRDHGIRLCVRHDYGRVVEDVGAMEGNIEPDDERQ